jgi:hypothetical protein
MTALLNATITTAISPAVTTTPLPLNGQPRNATLQGNFTYGSGGTSVDCYVQTTLDGGTTWADVAQFHFTTASARKVFNLSSATAQTTQVTPTDGSLSSNSAQDGVLGPQWRVKYQSSGTYAGGTTVRIDICTDQLNAWS